MKLTTPTANCVALLALLLFAANARAVTIDWVPVGNPGNPPDTVVMTIDGTSGYGAVNYTYNIGKYDVTTSQYVEFLNTKDPTGVNTLGLWNSYMGNGTYGGIDFNIGRANGDKYTLFWGRGDQPLNYITWYEAARFANWLNNGQGNGDTETGAYTLLGRTPTPSNGNSIVRNPGAKIFLPTENEWYKAAYYNPATGSYFQYPTSSNVAPIGSAPTALPNHANVPPGGPGDLTDVGAYTGTTSPCGAFDMGGNMYQWNETLINGSYRGFRGGSYINDELALLSSSRFSLEPTSPYAFRVASIPEPSTGVLAMLAGAVVWWWRKRFSV